MLAILQTTMLEKMIRLVLILRVYYKANLRYKRVPFVNDIAEEEVG